MSPLSYNLCIAACLGLGLSIYAYSVLSMPGGDARPAPVPVLQDKPRPITSAKPGGDTITGSISPSRDIVTDPIKPQAIRRQAAKIPGVRFAALGTQVLRPPNTKRWTPAVGYNPVVTPTKQAAPATARKPRRARAYWPYYRIGPSYGFAIGIPFRW